MENTFKNNLYKLLKKDARLWNTETREFNETLLKDLIDKLDEKLIEILLRDKEAKEKFFIKVKDVFVLKQNELKFFIDENKLDNSYTQYQNKIGLRVGNKLLSERNEVVLDWPFKDCVLEGGMTKEDQKRNEIFFNEVLAKDEIDRLEDPKALVNWKRYTAKGEEKVEELKRDEDGTIRENLIIKGNNLLALHSLKEQFAGKVKLIYIDPPYGKKAQSFYNDNFKNSTWLTFMRDRLKIAKDLLTNNGLIFIQIDDEQYAYLKVICDDKDLFDRENYISTITVKSKTPSGVGQESYIFDVTERILVYAKDLQQLEKNSFRIFDEYVDENSKTVGNYNLIISDYGKPESEFDLKTGKGRTIKVVKLKNFEFSRTPKKFCTKEWAYKNFENIFRLSPANGGLMKKITPKLPDGNCYIEYIPEKGKYANQKIKVYFVNREMVVLLSETAQKNEKEKIIEKMVNIHNNWTEESLWQGIASEGGVKLKNGKKPEQLIKRILDLSTHKDEIVLDYHLGSGTTCAVAHKMGRRFVGIEQLDYEENDSVIRLNNVIKGDKTGISKSVEWKGGGDFVYVELAKWNEEAKEKILKAKSLSELEKLFDELYERYFLNYNIKTKEFKEKIIKEEGFKKLNLNEQKKLFVEMLDMNQMYVNFSERADKKYNLSKEDIALSEEFYNTKK